MNKKIIIPLILVLFFVIFLIILLPFLFKTNNKKSLEKNTTQNNQPSNFSTQEFGQSSTNVVQNNSDFKVEYSTQTNRYIITKKRPDSGQKINDWLKQNNLSTVSDKIEIIDPSEMAANPQISQPVNLTLSPSDILLLPTKTSPELAYESNTNILVDLLNILLGMGRIDNKTTPTPSASTSTRLDSTISPTNTASGTRGTPNITLPDSISSTPDSTILPTKKTSGTPAQKYVYYAQCGGGFDSYPLPSGCTICYAGCGPTTVAMITASYADKNVTPKTIVDLYKQKGYYLGCSGSRYTDAKSALASYGLKTTDYMTFSSATIDIAAKDFKNYLNSGWTIFVLTYFCDGGCGHFFWITEISNNNDTWAYDPYYGKSETPPINEKIRYPFPKYRIAFGVKK